jgi:NADH:ubiquinone oxidoreductase subunit E
MPRRSDNGSRSVAPGTAPPPGHDELLERIHAFPRWRSYLLPALLLAQDELGWLPDWAIASIGEHLRVPKSEAYGVASSFPELRLEQPAEHSLRVCTGAACRLQGARTLHATAADFPGTVETTDCLFICGVAPAVELDGRLVGRATAEQLRV